MREEKKENVEKLPPFKEVWTHIPPSKDVNGLNTVGEWVKGIINRVEGVGKQILIVDDEVKTLAALKEILEYHGFIIDVATSGIEALDKLSRIDFDLVLSDIRMTAMDGNELCVTCKNHPQLKHIPFILFSGYYNTFESCADYFLAKPIDSSSLIKVINKIFEKYQIIREVEKIGDSRKKSKFFQVIPIDTINLTQLQILLDFIWVFQPRTIPLLKLSPTADLSIEEIRILLQIIEDQDTVLIVEKAKILRELLKSELMFIGGNPNRIFENLIDIKKKFDIWVN